MSSQIARSLAVDDIRAAWNRIFVDNNPFSFPFADWIKALVVLFPTYGYHLDRAQYDAVMATARDLGDTRYFLGSVEYTGDFFEQGEWWSCDDPPYERYAELPLTLENAFFSQSGTWGVIVSHEDHALAAGANEFLYRLSRRYQRWSREHDALLEYWSKLENSSWLHELKVYRR